MLTQLDEIWKTTSVFWKMEYNLKEIMQPHTIKSKNNDCGTAPGNLVLCFLSSVISLISFLFHLYPFYKSEEQSPDQKEEKPFKL